MKISMYVDNCLSLLNCQLSNVIKQTANFTPTKFYSSLHNVLQNNDFSLNNAFSHDPLNMKSNAPYERYENVCKRVSNDAIETYENIGLFNFMNYLNICCFISENDGMLVLNNFENCEKSPKQSCISSNHNILTSNVGANSHSPA